MSWINRPVLIEPARAAFLLLSTTLLLANCASVARIVYPLNEDAFKAEPGEYQLDPEHVSILFSVNHMGFAPYHGRFNIADGKLAFDPEDPESSSVSVRIQTDSLDTNSSALEKKLLANSMFDAANHPYIHFNSERITVSGDKTGTLTGRLTIKGISAPLDLAVAFQGSGTNPLTRKETVGFTAGGTFKRSNYGLNSWLPLVGDEITLTISAEFIKVE